MPKEPVEQMNCEVCGRKIGTYDEQGEAKVVYHTLDGGCCEACGALLCKACVLTIGGKDLCKNCAGVE